MGKGKGKGAGAGAGAGNGATGETKDDAASLLSSSSSSSSSSSFSSEYPALCVGGTVTRGPNWKWGRQDGGKAGGERKLGEVLEVLQAGGKGQVRVKWAASEVTQTYRYGNGVHDVIRAAAGGGEG